MSETWLRWQGRLGRMRRIAQIVALGTAALVVLAALDLLWAWQNPGSPIEVTVERLVGGEVGTERYVTVSGWTDFLSGYQATEQGRSVWYYYVAGEVGNLVLVRWSELPDTSSPQSVTVTGVTRAPSPELAAAIQADLSRIRDAGQETIPTLYVEQGARPALRTAGVIAVIALGLVLVLSLAISFFPGRVFGPWMIGLAPSAGALSTIRVIGPLRRLRSVHPFESGQGERDFDDVVASVEFLPEGRVVVYVHHISKRREEFWGVSFAPDSVVDIVPGKLYSWDDILVVRLRYRDERGMTQTLFLAFDNTGTQAGFVDQLREMGFIVSSIDMTLA